MKANKKMIPVLTAGVLVLAVGAAGITKVVSDSRKKNILNDMSSLTGERVQNIKSLVNSTEEALTHYGKAAQITDLLKDPDNKELAEKAQEYTEEYAQTIDGLEGIYASEFTTTRVLTHSNASAVGIVTRAEESTRKALQDSLLEAGDGVYNTGIIVSPASAKTILSMYKAIYDENKLPIGYTGIGVFVTTVLSDTPDIYGLNDEAFSLIDVERNRYIYNADSEALLKEINTPEITDLCSKLSKTDTLKKGTLEYKDDSGKHLAAYAYMPDYSCLLMLDGTR